MSKTADDGELVYGSGNVFRDFGRADADVQQTKALLAARIIGILDDEGLSTRKAERPHRYQPRGLYPHSQRAAWPLHH